MSSHFFEILQPLFHSLTTMSIPKPVTDVTPNKGGRPPTLSSSEIVAALVFHVLQGGGTFSRNLARVYNMQFSDGTLSERRTSLGTAPWVQAMGHFLSHLSDGDDAPSATWKGYRLVGVDGTTFNVGNTPTMKATATKTKTRRGEAAFYRIPSVVLVALSSHRPLAVEIGEKGESEGALAERIVAVLAEDDILIADRYYGSGKWVGRLEAAPSQPLYLLRVQERFGAVSVKRFPDGSKLVHVRDPDRESPILVREIKAKVRRPGNRWTKVRFWTNLLNEKRFPALELVALYALRWEQEIAFRELKEHIHSEIILSSHTLPTAVQEICALFMAQALVVSARVAIAAAKEIPVLQISFEKVLQGCRMACWLWAMVGREMDPRTWKEIMNKVEREIEWQATKPRRKRTCSRKVRQPVRKWPRLMKTSYAKGPIECKIRKS